MHRLLLVSVAAAGLAGCHMTPAPRVDSGQFYPHGRFAPSERERSYAWCRHVAIEAGNAAAASGVPGTLPTLYGPPAGVIRRAIESMASCMDARGYAWRGPS